MQVRASAEYDRGGPVVRRGQREHRRPCTCRVRPHRANHVIDLRLLLRLVVEQGRVPVGLYEQLARGEQPREGVEVCWKRFREHRRRDEVAREREELPGRVILCCIVDKPAPATAAYLYAQALIVVEPLDSSKHSR